MTTLEPEDERAVERLSFHLLKEAYGAVAGLLRKIDPATSEHMFVAVETQLQQTVRRMHEQSSEGAASTAVAIAVAENLVEVFDRAHRAEEARAATDAVISEPRLRAVA